MVVSLLFKVAVTLRVVRILKLALLKSYDPLLMVVIFVVVADIELFLVVLVVNVLPVLALVVIVIVDVLVVVVVVIIGV